MRNSWVGIALVLVAYCVQEQAKAQEGETDPLGICRNVVADKERLACYDHHATPILALQLRIE